MILKGLFESEQIDVALPRSLNADTMFTFLESIMDARRNALAPRVTLDFAGLDFIDPVGVVILSNVIEYLLSWGAKVSLKNYNARRMALIFLDDSGFFRQYIGQSVFPGSAVRSTTLPLNKIRRDRSQQYLLHDVMPWIADAVDLKAAAIDSVRSSLEEILHNVNDHSEVDYGCTFAQHFPQRHRIQIAISDFGRGIPNVVRTKVAGINDHVALRLACEEGFTTKTNVQNRGAGLPNLMRYVTQRNGGNVLLVAGTGALTATLSRTGGTKITTRRAWGSYPGTLVRVILRTDRIAQSVEDAELEPFEW